MTPNEQPAYTERQLVDAIQRVFDRWDVDRSGLLSLDEFRQGISREARSPDYASDPTVRMIASAITGAGRSGSVRAIDLSPVS